MTPGRAIFRPQPTVCPQRLVPGPARLCAPAPLPFSRGPRRFSPGFTLIEILIVVTIIGILVTLAQPSFNRAVTSAKEAALKENLFILRDVIDQFYADNTKYPTALSELVEKGYIRQVPKDPITGSAESWVIVPATDEQGQQVGVFDVKSGSDRTAHDGSRYNDW
jgi:general secretion pathway protein G